MKFPWFLPIWLLIVGTLAVGCKRSATSGAGESDEYLALMRTGKNYLDQRQAERALEVYQKAVKILPTDPNVHLNVANAHLLLGQSDRAIAAAEEALKLDHALAAAYFVKGSAHLRLTQFDEAVKALQTARTLDPGEPALSFQLGFAHFKLGHWDEAISLLSEVAATQPEHPSAHFHLSQAYQRADMELEAQQHLEIHQQIAEKNAGKAVTSELLERSKFTEARVPFRLEQPEKRGVAVKFVEDSRRAFEGLETNYHGPIAVLDPNNTGTNSLFVFEPEQGFRLLWNSNAVFQPLDEPYPATPGATYSKMLVGDMQNDRYEDVVVLGDRGAHVFRFATNGMAMDVGPFSRLQGLQASEGALVDLDFTGKLDLVAVTRSNELRLLRQFGPLLFTDITRTSGIPAEANFKSVVADDWPKDEMMDLIAGRVTGEPMLLAKQRGGLLVASNVAGWPAGEVLATGDLNNDLRTDLVTWSAGKVHVFYHGTGEKREIATRDGKVRAIYLVDYDNDGWLDIFAAGERLSAWRNLGQSGFEETSQALGLEGLAGPFSTLHFADFDVDGDTDLVAVAANGGLRYLRNDGGNANQQLKLRLLGNRSNASGLGVQIEVRSGGLQLVRTVQTLPIEIGVGNNQKLESMTVHWFNLGANSIDVPVDPLVQLPVIELILPEGSCPYMYVWDGQRFRFVTDLLGAAPIGLPVADGIYIEADPEEYAWIGDETNFAPRDGYYVVQITEELREVLYLDEAKLVVVDHPPGTEVHPTDKLRPRGPFPKGRLMTVWNERPLRRASTLSGREVADELRAVDGRRVSPDKLRLPQQRGMAEPHGVILDYGELPTERPLVLVMNGWLRFGGGMANINASHDPDIPFPFPTLEAEVNGEWRPVDVTVGAPAGKTKTILVELDGKLPEGARRLKVAAGFEIHWDRIALMEEQRGGATSVTKLAPSKTDLHWRGFSEFEDLPWDWPLTPIYDKVEPNPKWRITPGGWCTRYGPVDELIAQRDEGMVLMNGGDELTLEFAAHELPPRREGLRRTFFIYTDGWDKDADFHVRKGTTVGPLPWHGMNDQTYGDEPRPEFPSDALHEKYNTRWVEPTVIQRSARSR